MKTLPHRAAATTALILLAGCAANDPTGPVEALPRTLTAAEQEVIASSNRFAFDIFRELSGAAAGDNVFISPLSISMALGMAMNGAAGQTRDEMQRTLGFEGLTEEQVNATYAGLIELLLGLDPRVEMGIANSIWYREGFPFHGAFFDRVREPFRAEVNPLDFSDPGAADVVNEWAATATRGRIDEVLDAVRPDDVMYLLNAIYFKGGWTQRFDPADTRTEPFTTASGGTVNVPMMNGDGEYRLGRGDGFSLVELPYGGGAFAMTILLPDIDGTADELGRQLTEESWNRAVATLSQPRSIPLAMPRFTVEYSEVLNDALIALGMQSAFSGADFSRMSTEPLEISRVQHDSFVEVNEEGTEAAAVTTVTVVVTSAPQPVRVDRPFLFAIRERLTGTVVFLGKISDPSS